MSRIPQETILGEMYGIEIYEYYDGPRMFLASNNKEIFLVYWCDFTENGDGWLYVPITDETLSALKRNDIDYAEALMNPSNDNVYYVSSGLVEYAVLMHIAEVPNDFFPPHGHYLEHVSLWETYEY